MTTIVSRNEYPQNSEIDHSLDFDDLFSSIVDFDHDDDDEYDSSTMDIVSINNFTQEPLMPSLECRVCGAPAHGYNFNQITCESCKAFFRRNALRQQSDSKCRFSGSCVININTRRHCTHCRLKKCFDVQMRKDWIRTDEEKIMRQLKKLTKQQVTADDQLACLTFPVVIRKKNRLPIHRKQIVEPINIQNIFGFHRDLGDDDRILLNNITNSYEHGTNSIANSSYNNAVVSRSLVDFLNGENLMHESLIQFYKYIPEFKQLSIDDQILLIKCNLIKNINLHYIIVQKFQENQSIGLCMSQWISRDFHVAMSRTRRYFYRFSEHPLILKLALIVLLFSVCLSLPKSAYQYMNNLNSMNIYKIQEFYTSLLWRYSKHLFGEREAIRVMEVIITQMLNFQILMNEMEETAQKEYDVNKVSPLIQSLFQLN